MPRDTPRRLVAVTATAGIALTLAACSAGGSHLSGPTPGGGTATQPSSQPTTRTARAARPVHVSKTQLTAAWDRAVARVDQGTRFTVHDDYPGVAVSESGLSSSSPARFENSYLYRALDGSSETDEHVVQLPGERYIRESQHGTDSDTNTGSCWLRDSTDSPAVHPTVRALDDAIPLRISRDGTTVRATTLVEDVFYADGGHFADDLGLTRFVHTRVPIEVDVRAGTITGWSASDADVVRAGVAAGGHRNTFLRARRSLLGSSRIAVVLSPADRFAMRSVQAPDPAKTYDDAGSLSSDPACGVHADHSTTSG